MPRSSSDSGVQRQHIEVAIICVSGVRLAASSVQLNGGTWPTIFFLLLHAVAVLLEFGIGNLASPYQLRRSESHGIAQGLLAVPSVLTALAVVTRQGDWFMWLEVSLAAALFTLWIVAAQSRHASVVEEHANKAAVAVITPSDTSCSVADAASRRFPYKQQQQKQQRKQQQQQQEHCSGAGKHHDHYQSRASSTALTVLQRLSEHMTVQPGIGSLLVVAVAAAAAAVAGAWHLSSSQIWMPPGSLQQILQHSTHLVLGSRVLHQGPRLLAPLLGAALAPVMYTTIMKLLPGCFSIGEGILMTQGATILAVAAGQSLPSAAAFCPAVLCHWLPDRAMRLFRKLGACTSMAHEWALSLSGLAAAVVLIVTSVLMISLLLTWLVDTASSSSSSCRTRNFTSRRKDSRVKNPKGHITVKCSQWRSRLLLEVLLCVAIAAPLMWLAAAAVWTVLEVLPAKPWRFLVLLYWLGLLAITLPGLKGCAGHSNVPQIIVRKVYHLLAGGLFIPVFFWDLQLLCLSLAIGFAALVLLEVLRHLQLPRIGEAVQQFMQDFVDERDSGVIYVTHFTLLLGLAIPMWLSVGLPGIQALVGSSQQLQEHQQQQQPLQQACTSSTSSSTSSMCASNELAAADCSRLLLVMAGLSGMVIIGVGDTAASAVGKLWGRVPIYKGSRKTVEGMVAGVASSLGAWCLLLWCAGLRGGSMGWWLQLVLVTTGAGLMEACTSQLDNILLPLWYLPHLMLVQC